MKVSIITVTFNSASTIEDTLLSVINQDHNNIEYIIVDGRSTDDTLTIVEKYKIKISRVISEKDDGLYYAINKGISLATGDLIGILHSDDFYESKNIISSVVDALNISGAESAYGDLQYVERNNKEKIVRYWKSKQYKSGLFLKGWMPPHPAFFVKKDCYTKYGMFNTQLRSSADYELMLRLLHKHKVSTVYIPKVLVKMRTGGQSNVSLINRLKANKEDRLAWKLNGLSPGLFTTILKPLSKLKQYF